jgi:hypothetical protein
VVVALVRAVLVTSLVAVLVVAAVGVVVAVVTGHAGLPGSRGANGNPLLYADLPGKTLADA